EKALNWVQKKLRSSKKDSLQKQQQKIQATLMQKGFTQDVIQEVMAEIKQEKDTEQKQEALQHHGIKLIRKHHRTLSGSGLIKKMKEGFYSQGFQMYKINDFIEENITE